MTPVYKLVSLTWLLWVLRSFQRFTLPVADPDSSHQTEEVEEKSAYHYRISTREISRILSQAKPGTDTSY